MSKIADKDYLLGSQYQDTKKYGARLAFHTRFSTHKQSWFQWLFAHLQIPVNCRILEIGCGLGNLWNENLSRIPQEWSVILSDISYSMVKQSRDILGQRWFVFLTTDAEAIPFDEESFDAIVANHVLYHLPDRPKAFGEFCRILKPQGEFYASTVGEDHLRELSELIRRFDPASDFFWSDSLADSFTLESGIAELSTWFQSVEMYRYKDTLAVTEVKPIVDFVAASASVEIDMEKAQHLSDFLENEFKRQPVIHVTRDLGVFRARGKRSGLTLSVAG